LTEATRRRPGWETERDCSGNLGIGPTFPAVTNTELEKRSPWPLGLSLSSGVFRRGKFGRRRRAVQGLKLPSKWLTRSSTLSTPSACNEVVASLSIAFVAAGSLSTRANAARSAWAPRNQVKSRASKVLSGALDALYHITSPSGRAGPRRLAGRRSRGLCERPCSGFLRKSRARP
jgi:hypothetical protein